MRDGLAIGEVGVCESDCSTLGPVGVLASVEGNGCGVAILDVASNMESGRDDDLGGRSASGSGEVAEPVVSPGGVATEFEAASGSITTGVAGLAVPICWTYLGGVGGTGGSASFALAGGPRAVGELGVVLSSPKNDSRFFSVPNMPILDLVDPRP